MSLFILHKHTQPCLCGAQHRWSHIYEAQISGASTKLIPATSVPPGADIHVETITAKPTPLCFLCLPADMAERGALARAEWERTRRRKAQEARTAGITNANGHKPAARPITDLA